VGSYRFDDPAGVVGLEGHLVLLDGGRTVHAPLSYRAAPLADAEAFLVGTTEHSALGTRWVYDAAGDPVWATALATAMLTGGSQADLYLEVDGRQERREPRTTVRGSGSAGPAVPVVDEVAVRDEGPLTVVRGGGLELVVVRVVGTEAAGAETLTGAWPGAAPSLLAAVRAH
jgi:hypothetical protein